MNNWQENQEWESSWWGNCANTYGEEQKQIVYASKMGLKFFHNGKSPFNINMNGKKVLDIGGGPISLLLKCTNVDGCVVDPCVYPEWIIERYKCAKIFYSRAKGEDIDINSSIPINDEVWIYNVLQHVDDPQKVINNAREVSKIIRLFEWIDTGTSKGHAYNLTEKDLNLWLNGVGKVEVLNLPTLKGKCYFGIFLGKYYEKV